tara:strand:- start:6478 stop:7263 length:786 start_codon:yes stop_codon:yes gene_type:complete
MRIESTPLVSIVTVVFNGEKYLEQTIQSVLNQTYRNVEYIIIDGGSTDGTLDIIKKYQNDIALWISEPDKGVYDGMNKGIKLAKGELIGMINSDDWYELNTVELIVEKYRNEENNSFKIFHGDLLIHEITGDTVLKKFNPSLFKMLNYGVTYNHPTFFVTPDVYKKYTFNVGLISIADNQFILEILTKEKDVFAYINEVLANFRKGGISGQQSTISSIKSHYVARANAGFSTFMKLKALSINICYQIVNKSLFYSKKHFKK